jgi:hypothetical protein
MPIEGALRELALADLLQLVHLSRKSGVLTVRSPESPRAAELHFDRGAVVRVGLDQEIPRIGKLLLMAGKATEGQVERALTEQRREPGRRLGALLVEQGVSPSEVERQLRYQIEETVFDLVRWPEGEFRFEEKPVALDEPLAVRLGVELLLMDALRRMDEWGALANDRLDLALIPGLVDADTDGWALLSLQPAEWEVLAAVDGERTLRAIGHSLARSEIEIAKSIFSLIDRGLVELRPHEPQLIRTPSSVNRNAEARVRADLNAGRTESAAWRVAELLRGDPESGELHALRGEVEAAQGRWGDAVSSLATAVRLDPLNAGAYYSLGMNALRIGDFTRARVAFETFLRLPDVTGERRKRAGRAALLLDQISTLLEEEGGP